MLHEKETDPWGARLNTVYDKPFGHMEIKGNGNIRGFLLLLSFFGIVYAWAIIGWAMGME